MATQYEVYGPMVPQVSTGVSDAYEVLGVTADGASIRTEKKYKRIMTDLSGPEVPAEHQMLGEEAHIEFDLNAVDLSVLKKLLLRAAGNTAAASVTAAAGSIGAIGSLMGTGTLPAAGSSYAFSLYLPSSLSSPWVFPTCILQGPVSVKAASVQNPIKLSFYAWRFIPGTAVTPTDSNIRPAYTRVAPS